MPAVTVMVTTYPGGEKYLEETLESLRAQTFTDYTLYVVNDSRMDLPKNNEAFDNCTTEFIAFPHHDDIYLPTWLEESVAKLRKHPEAAACFSMDTFIDADGRRMPGGTRLPIPEQDTYDYKTVINAFVRHGNFLRCPTVVFRRSLVGDLRYGSDCGRASDTAFWFTVLHKAGPIVIIDKPLIKYRQHEAQGTELDRIAGPTAHFDAMEYAANLNLDALDWDNYIHIARMSVENRNNKEVLRVKKKAAEEKKTRLIVVHEPPDNAGTGVVAAARVRKANEGEGEIAFYLFPNKELTAVQEGWFKGCPVIGCAPSMFRLVVNRFKPDLIEYHHTLYWGEEILAVETKARKELYLHDRWMWSDDPHGEGEFRDTRKYLGGISIFGNSEWTCRVAKEKLGVEVELFDPFVPLPNTVERTLRYIFDPSKISSWDVDKIVHAKPGSLVEYNGNNLTLIHPINRFRKRIGFFGGFSTTKGVHILLQAARKLPDVLFVLFTQPPDGLCDGRRVYGHPNVVVMGPYARGDMHLLVHLVDLAVVPSLFESRGLVAMELKSLGVKVITTKTGGMDGTIEPDNIDSLIEAINEYM